MKNFGQWVKALRKANGFTQLELAKKLGVTDTYISKIENHTFEVLPSVMIIRKLARILGCSEDALLDASSKVDTRALCEKAAQHPPTAILLRMIATGELMPYEIEQIIGETA